MRQDGPTYVLHPARVPHILTTRLCSRRARWRAPPLRDIASSSSSRRTASLGWHRKPTSRAASPRGDVGSWRRAPGAGSRPRRASRLCGQRPRPRAAPGPSGAHPLRPGRHGRGCPALAAILDEEQVDVLLGYDANGGYGHRDHKVHHVARRAAELAGTPRLLEATVRGHHLPRPRPRRQGVPVPAGLRPAQLRPRLLGTPRHHPPDLGPPPHRRQTGLDAGPRLPASADGGADRRSPRSCASPARSTTSSSAGSGTWTPPPPEGT